MGNPEDKNGEGLVEEFDESEELDEDDIVTISDEAGNEVACVVLAIFDVEGNDYAMLAPADQLDGEEGDDLEVFLFRYELDEENNVEHFVEIDDEAIYEKVQATAAELMQQSEEEGE